MPLVHRSASILGDCLQRAEAEGLLQPLPAGEGPEKIRRGPGTSRVIVGNARTPFTNVQVAQLF